MYELGQRPPTPVRGKLARASPMGMACWAWHVGHGVLGMACWAWRVGHGVVIVAPGQSRRS